MKGSFSSKLSAIKHVSVLRPPVPWDRVKKRDVGDELVICLHGLWRSKWAMEPLAKAVTEAGFSSINLPYPSFSETLEEMVERVAELVERESTHYRKIHFVTHSLGGVIVRRYLAGAPHEKCARVLMVAPPLRGSHIIDWLEGSILQKVLGSAGKFLSSESMAKESELVSDSVEIAVIMGNKVRLPLLHHMINGESDGIVRVDTGRVDGLAAFKIVEADHTLITVHPEVLEAAKSFLKTGGM